MDHSRGSPAWELDTQKKMWLSGANSNTCGVLPWCKTEKKPFLFQLIVLRQIF